MKSAVVTGAFAGIGKATAAALVQEGYAVIGTSRNASAIPAAASTTATSTWWTEGVDLVVELGHRSATAAPGDSP
jgi:NADP-dependent 3-hydroxy acid dehydrogenase YdfG